MEQMNDQETVAMNVPNEEQPQEAAFLGLSRDQVALLAVLSSFFSNLTEVIKQPDADQLFQALVEEENYRRLDYALGWVARNRDDILALVGTANFALGLLAKVQDTLIKVGFQAGDQQQEATEQPQQTEGDKQ